MAGYRLSKKREGKLVHVTLLSVSAAVMILGDGTSDHSLEEIAQTLASMKQVAKNAVNKMAVRHVGGGEQRTHQAA
jgi:hypothetical protein